MSKYYVQSGTFRGVVNAESARKAALWAVGEVIQQVIPTQSDSIATTNPSSASQEKLAEQSTAAPTSVTVLAGKVTVDQRGFDRDDSVAWPVVEIFAQWSEMVVTLDRLQQMLDRPTPAPRWDDSQFGDMAA